MKSDSVRIAGAGLSGLSAAIGLARRGHPVEIFERNADSGVTRHADWDAIENWTTEEDFLALLQEWGIEPSFEIRAPASFEVIDPRGNAHSVHLQRPFFYLLQRGVETGSIEQALKFQALEQGVTIHYGRTAQRHEVDIWAAGARSAGFFLGTGITFRTSHPDLVAGLVNTLAAPKAYAYLVIVDGFATLSVVLTRDFRHARDYLERCTQIFRKHRSFEMNDVKRTSGFGGLVGAFWQPASGPLILGEAAGLQDFLWGFGIRHALHSGQLAARAIHEGLDYGRLLEREIRPLVRASLINRWFYDRVGNRAYSLLIRHFAPSDELSASIRPWYRGQFLHKLMWPLVEHRYSPKSG